MQIIVNDLAVTYYKSGNGPILVLLHGWADTSQTFNELLPSLEAKYTVIRIDLAGFGGSQAPHSAWGLKDYAAHVRDILQKIAILPNDVTILGGHSNGGAIAVTCVAGGYVKPKKLLLIASSGIRSELSFKKMSLTLFAKIGKIGTLALPYATKAKLRTKLYQKAGSDLLVAQHMQPTFKKIVKQDILADAEKIHVPTLLIYGELDTATPVYYGQLLQNAIEGSTLRVIQNASHFLHQEYTSEVTDYITEFTK